MLRWWPLLEKHSCKATKLHSKPCRFKIFLETLEHQLLKDQKKNIRKRPNQGGNCFTTPTNKPARQRRRQAVFSIPALMIIPRYGTKSLVTDVWPSVPHIFSIS
ncbi:TSL-kinase interacting protein 1-like isoform X2 [Helianthus annuus]|uniref:TSL-kinase interacting protein 1-like isoform X2 n=1 Tax=Helianthus annuus TaxID=4232 RepID=UPI001652BE69|nr:TSL-kinase interacting protein 1-like isoform X2 [Helianthus annuus]